MTLTEAFLAGVIVALLAVAAGMKADEWAAKLRARAARKRQEDDGNG